MCATIYSQIGVAVSFSEFVVVASRPVGLVTAPSQKVLLREDVGIRISDLLPEFLGLQFRVSDTQAIEDKKDENIHPIFVVKELYGCDWARISRVLMSHRVFELVDCENLARERLIDDGVIAIDRTRNRESELLQARW